MQIYDSTRNPSLNFSGLMVKVQKDTYVDSGSIHTVQIPASSNNVIEIKTDTKSYSLKGIEPEELEKIAEKISGAKTSAGKETIDLLA